MSTHTKTHKSTLLARLVREPLVHFMMIGAVLFGVYAGISGDEPTISASASRTVRITAGDVEWMKQTWARQRVRTPTEEELRDAVLGYLKEELLAREARLLRLDENDTVVRRRLAQKMEFLVQDTVLLAEPSEEELHRLYDTQRERFRFPARITFTHVYFNRDRRGSRVMGDVEAALRQLSLSGASASRLGDRFLAQYDYADVDEQEVATVFGPQFGRRVFTLEPGQWQGPIESGYGLHLVRVTSKQAAQPQEFATVREKVLTLWRQQREQEGREQYFASLRKRYAIVVDENVKHLVPPFGLAKEQGR